MGWLTAVAPLLEVVAERVIASTYKEVPCDHEDGTCDKQKHMKPTPTGASLLLVGLLTLGWVAVKVGAVDSRLVSLDERIGRIETALIHKGAKAPAPPAASASLLPAAQAATKEDR